MRLSTITGVIGDPGYPLSPLSGRGIGAFDAKRTCVASVCMRRRRDVELAWRAIPVFSAAAASAMQHADVPNTGQVCVPLSPRERSP
ncbi:MAG: hypothetical protein ACRDQ7_20435 [Haloechinothrix sp.]